MWTTASLPRFFAASIAAPSTARSRVGDLHAVRRAVVVDDLDVVGALGDPRVDEGLRVAGRRQRGNLQAVLGAVALGRGHEGAGREEVGAARARRPRRCCSARIVAANR